MSIAAIIGLMLLVILVCVLLLIKSSAEVILAVLGIVCVVFIIKNLIQDLYFYLIKNRRGVFPSLFLLAVDITRVIYFYKLIHQVALDVTGPNTGLLATFGSISGFIITLFFGGGSFLAAELSAFMGVIDEDYSMTIICLLTLFLSIIVIGTYYFNMLVYAS